MRGGGANRRPVEPPLRCHNLSRLGLQRFMGFSATKKLHILYWVQDKGNFNWMPRFVRSIHHDPSRPSLSQKRGIGVFYETILCLSNFQFLFLSPQNLFHV